MTDPTAAAAGALLGAYASARPIRPLSEVQPWLSVADAYEIQRFQVKAWTESGQRVVGYKVGLTSTAMQEQLGVAEPDFGHLLDSMQVEDAGVLRSDLLIAPRVEPEIAFVLGTDVSGPGLSVSDLENAIDRTVIALEIIDSRIVDWKITLADTIADNASSSAFVLGAEVPADVDLANLDVALSVNDVAVGAGRGDAVMGHPINGALWLVNMLGEFGQSVPAGSIILAGSMSAAVEIVKGDVVKASFGRVDEVTVEVA